MAAGTGGGTMTETGIDAVLFDLHNTTMDGNYAAVGIAHVAPILSERWGIDPDEVDGAFVAGLRVTMANYHDRDFYLMSEVFEDAFGHVAASVGAEPTRAELADLERMFWEAGIPAVRPVDGAIEAMDALRESGRRVGVVSWADEAVFDDLIGQLGFRDHIDVAVCSETAQSCKPHPAIFQYALDALDVRPDRAMFVGDSIDQDIVGGNRLGMSTVLVAGTRYSSDIDAFGDDPDTQPDHRIRDLREIVELVDVDGRVA
jgi:HAD superfamily hydrolase (TIGR01509 family)